MSLNILEPTKAKGKLLRETYTSFLSMVKEALGYVGDVRLRAELHEKTYDVFRSKYDVASQLIVEAASYAWSIRRTVDEGIWKCVVRFDKRLFSFKKTKRGNPVLSLRLNRERVGLPISQDCAYKRIQQHIREGWKITSIIMKRNLKFLAVISKNFPEPSYRPNWMGIDVNSSKIAISIISKDKMLKQTYFGQDVSVKQLRFEERRAKLQSYRDKGSSKAGLKLKRLSGKQRNYVRTRIWQIANEIVKLAKQSNANIAIERLRHLRKSKGELSKKSRKKVNRIPYSLFKHALKCVAERESVTIEEVKPNYTSQTCPICGHVGKGNWKGYIYFKCAKCGYEADRDRVASLNLALSAAPKASIPKHYFSSQNREGEASVSRLGWKDEGCRRHQTTL
ncbi:MAG: IS200/IS605 family element transposase accessory protein TnpB, partial [Nitrososphaeria archaeon]|nr:IS200/IS605 family element transposase accessory protein TnpB [Nitrososphaeria archaeon]